MVVAFHITDQSLEVVGDIDYGYAYKNNKCYIWPNVFGNFIRCIILHLQQQ